MGTESTDHKIHSQNTFSITDQWEKDNSIYFPSTSLIIQLIQLNIQAQKAFQTGAVLQQKAFGSKTTKASKIKQGIWFQD